MMLLRTLYSFLVAIVVAGCGHLPYISQHDLEPAARTPSVELVQEISYSTRLGWNNSMAVGLARGTYVPILEDKDGVYYKGPDDCVLLTMRENGRIVDTRDGGIWLPKPPAHTRHAKIYSYEFSGKAYRTSETRANPGEAAVDTAILNQAITNTPQGTSPIVAGVGAGIATGLIAVLAEEGRKSKRMVLMTDELPRDFVTRAIKRQN